MSRDTHVCSIVDFLWTDIRPSFNGSTVARALDLILMKAPGKTPTCALVMDEVSPR
jgi:hypothetical protein